jgi:quercetin dioxygenase-like cupin family protein
MDSVEFESELQREGFTVIKGEFRSDPHPQAHDHAYDVRFLVLDGTITIVTETNRKTYGPGQTCFVPAGTRHQEYVEAEGMRYIAGTRQLAGQRQA